MRSEEQTTFRAVTVGRRGLELLRPLVERFCAAGVTQWDSDTLLRVAWHRLATPLFRVWALVRQGSNEPLGFLVAQVQAAEAQTELYLLAAYMEPGLPLRAGHEMLDRALRWGSAMGCERSMVRTVRGDSNGLAEPKAWERLGFSYESTLLTGPMTMRPVEELEQAEEVAEDGTE